MASAATSNTRGIPRRPIEILAQDLYTRHRTQLEHTARRHAYFTDDAEDAVQDALILFIDHFDPTGDAPPLAWITLTLKRRCWALNRARETRIHREQPHLGLDYHFPNPERDPQEHTEAADTVNQLRQQLAHLKPDERHALGLSILGYTYREIAKLHGWTYTKVCRCIREGRATMRNPQEKEPP